MQLRRSFRFPARGVLTAAMLVFLSLVPAAHAGQRTVPVQDTQSQVMPTQDAQTQNTQSQDTHLVSPAQLQQQVRTMSAARQQNIDTLTQFLSTPQALQVMQSHRIDPAQVKHAIPTLSDAELSDLSARAAQAQHDFAAGFLGIGTFLLIILIVIVIIVVAIVH